VTDAGDARAGLVPPDVEVWWLRLDRATPALLERYARVLSAEERARAARSRVESARRELAAARGLLRTVLSRHADVAAEAWVFGTTPNGKPVVVEPARHARVCFSVSHTRDAVACAVASDRAVGVDVEPLARRRTDVTTLAARYFHTGEVAALDALDDAARAHRFLELWTLKESYVKARGLRLADVLRHAAFAVERDRVVRAIFDAALDDDPRRWTFALSDVGDAHVAALTVATTRGPARIEWRDALHGS
jgi:4'-phosphopantetheinyl transferase